MKIVANKQYPDMYHIQWPDGTISTDFYNKTRAKELMRRNDVIELKTGESTSLYRNQGIGQL